MAIASNPTPLTHLAIIHTAHYILIKPVNRIQASTPFSLHPEPTLAGAPKSGALCQVFSTL
ncbi:MAG: hypothetical protein R6V27_11755 [Balneolaceae bacterium]